LEKPARRRRAKRWLFAAGALASVAAAIRSSISPVRVQGESMIPTLPPGSLVAVAPLRRDPGLGCVVVVRRPDGGEHIKRIVAGPGDRFVGPAGLTIALADDEFAVAGDNRSASTDSRRHGPVKRGATV